MEKYLPLLRHAALFRSLDEKGIRDLWNCLNVRIRRYERGAFLLRAGDKPTAVGLVLSGGVYLVREDFWGNNAILTDVAPGETFAEAAALIGDRPLFFGAVAAEPTEAVFLPVNRLRHTCAESCGCHRQLIENLLIAVAERNLIYERKCGHLSLRTTREKLLSFLSEQSAEQKSESFEIPYNRQQLADYLSVDRSAMSAELSRMQADGLLRYRKNRFHLLRREET